jgi:prolyl-tRNA editing enzyme YbaK/EbsC (Cys-tRNA(Pro) deacylase)
MMTDTGSLSRRDLAAFLASEEIRADILDLEHPTPTVESAAHEMDTTVDRIVKTLLFYVEDTPVLVIAAGMARVNGGALAQHFHVEAGEVRLASPVQVLRETGYSVGAVPPFGHQKRISVVMDISVPENGLVFAGGGSDHALMRLDAAELRRVTGAMRIHVTSSLGDSPP